MSLKTIAGIVGSMSILVGAIFTIDTRYVHADEFKKQMFAVKDSIADLRRARLEDEVFKIELIPQNKRTDADKALLDRYKRQIREIDFRREKEGR